MKECHSCAKGCCTKAAYAVGYLWWVPIYLLIKVAMRKAFPSMLPETANFWTKTLQVLFGYLTMIVCVAIIVGCIWGPDPALIVGLALFSFFILICS